MNYNQIKLYSAPTSLNLEITDKCNVKCRHCYNYWREDGLKKESMTKERFDQLLDQFVKSNISISINSNLMVSSVDMIKRLSSIGVDHILTSLTSYDEDTNDFIV